RYGHVTGVQTCALPISVDIVAVIAGAARHGVVTGATVQQVVTRNASQKVITVQAVEIVVGVVGVTDACQVVIARRTDQSMGLLEDRKSTRLNSSHVAIS